MRIDVLPQSEAAVVYPNTNRLDDFDIVDLHALSVWKLRVHSFTASSRGVPVGLVEMRIKRVVVYRHEQPERLLGRVIELPSRWPVQDALIKDSSGMSPVKTLANGAFVTDRLPSRSQLIVEKSGYECLSLQPPGATKGSFVTVELRKKEFKYGDVVEVISRNDLAAASFSFQSIGFRGGTLNLLMHQTDTACLLVPLNTVDHAMNLDSPDVLKRSYEPSIGPLGFVECGPRLIGITHWPGKLLAFDKNPPEVVAELKHPDGTRLYWPRGTAFDGQWLWFTEQDAMNDRFALYAFDLDHLVITNVVTTIDRGIYGLAWDGKQFWVSSTQGQVYPVDREAALLHRTIEMAKGVPIKGRYDALAFGEGYLWGFELRTRRICKIKVTD